MKNATACTKEWTKLLKSLPEVDPPEFPDQDDPICALVQSFLLWESTTEKAQAAYEKIRGAIVDHNDLRVSMPNETLAWIGTRYPKGLVRCERLRAVLRHVYLREHTVSLEPALGLNKRDLRKYLDSLEGMVPYVASRVMLVAFNTHSIPVDGLLREFLVEAGAADEASDETELTSWLTRQVRAGDGLAVHYRLQAWAEKQAGRRGVKTSKAPRTRKTSSKKTTKKSTGKAAATSGESAKKTPAAKSSDRKPPRKKKTAKSGG